MTSPIHDVVTAAGWLTIGVAALAAGWLTIEFVRAPIWPDPVDQAIAAADLTATAVLNPDDDTLPDGDCPCEDCDQLTDDAAQLAADVEQWLRTRTAGGDPR